MKRAPAIAVRAAYLLVFAWNVLCALQFVIDPGSYTAGFELSGVAGQTAVRGIGVAFLMWNATYPAAIVDPRRFCQLAVVVLVQQAIGLAGECLILATLPSGHAALVASIGRFVAFDAVGLVLMLVSFVWMAVSDRKGDREGVGL